MRASYLILSPKQDRTLIILYKTETSRYDYIVMNDSFSRVTRSKAAARANYNRLSRWYDWIAGSEAKYRRIGVQALAAQPGECLLEIGFGTGQCLLDFARQVGPDGFVCGIDLSDGMAAVAQGRISEVGLSHRAGIALADAVQAPFREGCFDAIFMSFTLELFDTPEIPQVLRLCRQVLRPGGRLVVVTLVKTEQPNFAERAYEWFHARMPVAVDCRPIPAQAALREAGFEIAEVIAEKMWGLPVEILVAHNP
jgi:demethylmenaquinone methyltransferase/2-methoxy-6-polyprenyl-1,4-benzoquinol methylase